MFFPTKTLGIFLTATSTTITPLILFGGQPFQWISYQDFVTNWGGQELINKHRGQRNSYATLYSNCKVAVNWRYFDNAFLFRCDITGNGYYNLNLVKNKEDKKDLYQEINQYVNNIVIKKDRKKDYIVITSQ